MSLVNAPLPLSALNVAADFRLDAGGRDSDTHSRSLRDHHQALWEKPLPSGDHFSLTPIDRGRIFRLLHVSSHNRFSLSSDQLITALRKRCRDFYSQFKDAENQAFHRRAQTLGGRIIFPSQQVDGKYTINQARGTHPLIRDRFDLTLECIRRYYAAEDSPLSSTLERYSHFFNLFQDFQGYVDFFLLQDIAQEGEVQFFLPFDGFRRPALPRDMGEYVQFRDSQMNFVRVRNQRILHYCEQTTAPSRGGIALRGRQC